MRALPVAAALLCLCVLPGRAQAQAESSVLPADRTAIMACLRDSGQSPRTCIGTIAVVCGRQDNSSRDETRIACTRREAAVWRERLDFGLQALSQRLESGARTRLASVQRSWEAYAPQKCALMGELQAPAQAPAVQAGCDLRETAVRAIEVERLARRQAQGAGPRPQIER